MNKVEVTQSAEFQQTDEQFQETIKYLKAFGKTEYYIRCLEGKSDPITGKNKYSGVGAKDIKPDNKPYWVDSQLDQLIEQLLKQIKKGRCPYIVVNNGGRNSESIKNCSALFSDFDIKHGLTKEMMLERVSSLMSDKGLPPNLIVETRNGYQFFWVFEEPIDIETWKNLQYRLWQYLESDPCTRKNLTCLMRIPGFPHLQTNAEEFITKLVSSDEKIKYEEDDFNSILPPLTVEEYESELGRDDEEHKRYIEELAADGLEFHDFRTYAKNLKYFNPFGRTLCMTAQCPVHTKDNSREHSAASLHIFRDSGKFNCHGGCSRRDIYNEICNMFGLGKYKVNLEKFEQSLNNKINTVTLTTGSTSSIKDGKEALYKDLFDFLSEVNHEDYKGADLEDWLSNPNFNLEASINIASENLGELLQNNVLNGHTSKGLTLLSRAKESLGENNSFDQNKPESDEQVYLTLKTKHNEEYTKFHNDAITDTKWKDTRNILAHSVAKIFSGYQIEKFFQGWESEIDELFTLKDARKAKQKALINKKAAKPESLRFATEEAKKVLAKNLSDVEENIELDEIRVEFDIAPTNWDKQIKALRKEFSKDKRDALILKFIKTSDETEKFEIRTRICTQYSLSRSDFDELIRLQTFEKIREKRPVKFFNALELLEMPDEEEEWIFPGLLAQKSSTIITALGGTGKTKATVDLVSCLLQGEEFLGIQPSMKNTRVIYTSSDQSLKLTKRYFRQRKLFDNKEATTRLQINGGANNASAWTILDLPLLKQQIEEFKPDLIVIDSLRSALIQPLGLDENAVEVGKWINDISDLCIEYGCAIIFIHHNNKGKGEGIIQASGSTAITGTVDAVISMNRKEEPGKILTSIKVEKSRFGENLSFSCEFDGVDHRFYLSEEAEAEKQEAKTLSDSILQLLEDQQGTRLESDEIYNAIGGNMSSIKKTLSNLASKEKIRCEKHPVNHRCRLYSSLKFEPKKVSLENLTSKDSDCPF